MAMSEEKYIEMCKYEREYASHGAGIIGGIDEAGRGPLAGPVVAGCVLFRANGPFPKADDSKKLSEAKRELLFDEIINNCLAWGVGIIDNNVIDDINILQATHMAMHLACENAMKMLEEKYGKLVPCKEMLGNGPAEYYMIDGFKGKIGFISAVSHKFCHLCNRIRLTADGFLKTCLQYDKGVELRPLLRAEASDDMKARQELHRAARQSRRRSFAHSSAFREFLDACYQKEP